MARIGFSPLVVSASGKVKDTVFSRWKGRPYIRARVTPSNPQSEAQTLVRESMARCVELWQSLPDLHKTHWNHYASTYSISGYNAFVKANRYDEQAGDPLVTCPVNPDVPDFPEITCVEGSGDGEIDITWTHFTPPAAADVVVCVRHQTDAVFSAFATHASAWVNDAITLTGLTGGYQYQVYCLIRSQAELDFLYGASAGHDYVIAHEGA
jgi:hypothetical protein